jgi:elongation factor P
VGIPATQIRKGMILEVDGGLFKVHEFTHVTPGKGQAVMQTRLRNLDTGSLVEKRFRSAESVEVAHQDNRKMQYLYQDGELYTFMDMETYDQVGISTELLGDSLPYLLENMEVTVVYVSERPLSVDLPGTVEMEVIETEPALKGATAAAQTKPAKLETGLVVQVPPFVNQGDRIRVDTNTGEYLTRA